MNQKNRGGVLNTPNVSFVAEDNSVRYLLEYDPYNGYEYVDLGLPSGLKWATCNVGATSPEQAGLYFAWGETTGYTAEQVTSGVRAFSEDEYNAGPAASISANLTLEQDAAHVNMGGNWRMPTIDELMEMTQYCKITYPDNNNAGDFFILTSKINGNYLILPKFSWQRGDYWLSTFSSISHAYSIYLSSRSGDEGEDINFYHRITESEGLRRVGKFIRGVCQ